MELDKVLQKRVKGMAVRILACIEHTVACHLVDMGESDEFSITGSEFQILRSEILNAAGDTSRSLTELINNPPKGVDKVSLSREVMGALGRARVGFVEDGEEDIPVFRITGDFNLLSKIRDHIGTGVVYNKTYTCVGIDVIVNFVLPFLDKAQLTGINIAGGDYKAWRKDVCDMYLKGLGDE